MKREAHGTQQLKPIDKIDKRASSLRIDTIHPRNRLICVSLECFSLLYPVFAITITIGCTENALQQPVNPSQ